MQERMTGNIRDTDLAFQGAEAVLRDGEEYIEGLTTLPSMYASLRAYSVACHPPFHSLARSICFG
jgi:type IV pilus assembly protein PilX